MCASSTSPPAARLHCCIVNMFECYHTSPHTARPPQASTQQKTFKLNWLRNFNLWQTPGCVSVSADMKHRSWCALGWAAHFLWCAVWEMGEVHAQCAPALLLPSYPRPLPSQGFASFRSDLAFIFSHVFFAYFLLIKEGSPLAPVAAARLELAEYNVHQNISGHFCRPGAPCCRL